MDEKEEIEEDVYEDDGDDRYSDCYFGKSQRRGDPLGIEALGMEAESDACSINGEIEGNKRKRN